MKSQCLIMGKIFRSIKYYRLYAYHFVFVSLVGLAGLRHLSLYMIRFSTVGDGLAVALWYSCIALGARRGLIGAQGMVSVRPIMVPAYGVYNIRHYWGCRLGVAAYVKAA